MPDIKLENIRKTYGDVLALKDISLNIRHAEIFGLIGPDGAGKTSLIRIITSLLLPDSGTAFLGDLDIVKDFKILRSKIGYMPGKFSLYHDLTVEENLEFFATVFGSTIKENYYLIKDIYNQLEPFKKRRAGKLSGGMKQKLALCCALIHKPEFLILDEPTTGVDAVSRKEFWDMLQKLKTQGITIFVSTPYMDEALRCDRVALIQKGELLAVDAPAKLGVYFDDPLFEVRATNMYQLKKKLELSSFIRNVNLFGSYLHVISDLSETELKNKILEFNIENTECRAILPGIEDVFIKLMSDQERRQND
jgi:ABC-type multidrug transport system ATPase subunit